MPVRWIPPDPGVCSECGEPEAAPGRYNRYCTSCLLDKLDET